MRLLSGQGAFVLQRLSALLLLAYVAATALRLAFGPSASSAQWQAWAARPLGAALLLLLTAAVIAHAWVGVRDVALDYVKPPALRLPLLAAAAVGLTLLAVWAAVIVLSHAL